MLDLIFICFAFSLKKRKIIWWLWYLECISELKICLISFCDFIISEEFYVAGVFIYIKAGLFIDFSDECLEKCLVVSWFSTRKLPMRTIFWGSNNLIVTRSNPAVNLSYSKSSVSCSNLIGWYPCSCCVHKIFYSSDRIRCRMYRFLAFLQTDVDFLAGTI